MIAPPVVTTPEAMTDYLKAVHKITGVWQAEAAGVMNFGSSNKHIAKMWPLTFTEEQQQAIIVEFMARRLAR